MKTFIGCSGFHYKDWINKFYPEKLPKKEWLSYYAKSFNTVEINNTFYRMPEEKNLRSWMDQTPEGFQFTIKANRYFTHQKKLHVDDDFRDMFDPFISTVKIAGSKLGCVLWQLPGNLHMDESRLSDLFRLFDKTVNHVIEFRHESWFTDNIYSLLSDHKVGFCMLSAPGNLPDDVLATAPAAYLRFHGKSTWYNYYYSDKEIRDWFNRLRNLKDASHLYVYFNNDHNAWAVENAKMLKAMFE